MKGLRSVILRILQTLGIDKSAATGKLDKYLRKLIDKQNLQSSSCIKAIGNFLRKPKPIVEDELHDPIKTY